ncbi:MAG TPA: sensor histidine kinase, partial [Xanthobacteraceae bacterium]|nr:sensor histidine kinase [Xanthobacteraceae bacterium]
MTDETAARPEPVRTPRFGLSGKLLVLTILFVMIAEVLIYVPSVANFRVVWLKDRLATAYTAALVLDAAPNGVVSDALAKKILDSIGARAVAMKMGNSRRMLAVDDMPPTVAATYDMRTVYVFDAIVDAFTTMLDAKNDVIRVVGPAPMGGEYIDLVMDEQPLRKAMLRYSTDILFLSLVISCITAALVYLALHYLFVRPMRRVTANMMAFRADPENSDRVIAPSARNDEIGTAERELATMQIELASMLHQKNRLASLGLAVSKINHDLRNLLASAQLFSERLAKIPDPGVQRFAPKLVHALERAIAFCQSTLSYGRLQEPPPDRKEILLEPLVEEVHETLGLGPDAPIRWISAVERGLVVEAD